MLSNGAYILSTFEPESRRVLEMNENYWDKDNIFISRINYNYNKEAKTLAPELFLRGEVSEADIPAEILDEWMADEERKNMMINTPPSTSSNFLGFNFEPMYEEEYGPDNWLKAVNSENFRKSIYYALDREAAVMTSYPYNYEGQMLNTITTKNFVDVNGVDYTQLEPLKELTNTDQHQEDKALEYKAAALEELSGTVDFPVTVVAVQHRKLRSYQPGTGGRAAAGGSSGNRLHRRGLSTLSAHQLPEGIQKLRHVLLNGNGLGTGLYGSGRLCGGHDLRYFHRHQVQPSLSCRGIKG